MWKLKELNHEVWGFIPLSLSIATDDKIRNINGRLRYRQVDFTYNLTVTLSNILLCIVIAIYNI
jgi:hypothetical protein